MIFIKFLFLFIFILITNIPYKKAIFNKVNIRQALLLSTTFIASSFFLFIYDYKKVTISLNYITIIAFIATTTLWFIFPRFIRLFGKYPNLYIKNKINKERFVVKFEMPSIIVKYFEILS